MRDGVEMFVKASLRKASMFVLMLAVHAAAFYSLYVLTNDIRATAAIMFLAVWLKIFCGIGVATNKSEESRK